MFQIEITALKPETPVYDPPMGAVDSPLDGATVAGTIPITGWVVDDVGVNDIWIKNKNTGDLLGQAIMLEEATPEIAKQFPLYPGSDTARWYFDLGTYRLPDGFGDCSNGNCTGDGLHTLEVIAWDWEFQSTSLGTIAIKVDNANATQPFGQIMTPTLQQSISGSDYVSKGWAVTTQPNTIHVDGSTIKVYLDGMFVGNPDYDNRDIGVNWEFPGYNNSGGPVGEFSIDTTTLLKGNHSIEWIMTDDAGNVGGTGKRYFLVE